MPRRSSIAVAFSTSSNRVVPPDDLLGDARNIFCDLVLGVRPDHFQNSDVGMLCVFSRALALEKVASAGLAADGYTDSDWLPVLQASTRCISTFSRMLRLNPSARSMSSTASEPEPVNAYEKLAMESRRDGRN